MFVLARTHGLDNGTKMEEGARRSPRRSPKRHYARRKDHRKAIRSRFLQRGGEVAHFLGLPVLLLIPYFCIETYCLTSFVPSQKVTTNKRSRMHNWSTKCLPAFTSPVPCTLGGANLVSGAGKSWRLVKPT